MPESLFGGLKNSPASTTSTRLCPPQSLIVPASPFAGLSGDALASFGGVPEEPPPLPPPQADAPAAATINRVRTDARPRARFTYAS